MNELEEVKVLATAGDFEAFKESLIWKDFVRELNAWQEGFKREMMSITDNASTENPSTASVLLHMGDINGRIKAVEYMLSLPDVLMSIVESQKEMEKDNQITEEE